MTIAIGFALALAYVLFAPVYCACRVAGQSDQEVQQWTHSTTPTHRPQ